MNCSHQNKWKTVHTIILNTVIHSQEMLQQHKKMFETTKRQCLAKKSCKMIM